jgi:hypothetical protein
MFVGFEILVLILPQITNFIIQRDNRLNIEIAQSSRRIAEESRRDNLLNIELAKATAQVAEETRQDSAAMKTIAVLTLTFLPGTFIAVCLYLRKVFLHMLTNSLVVLQHERCIHIQPCARQPNRLAKSLDILRRHDTSHNCDIRPLDLVAQILSDAAQGAPRAGFEGR